MKDLRFAKLVVFINSVIPLSLLAWDAWDHQLGANPVNSAIRITGMTALVFICLTLLVTPLRRITGLQWLFHFRRMLGLFSFFYASCHFLLFFLLDRGGSVSDTFNEMLKRPYLFVGSAALLLMIPLAATSFNAAIRYLTARRWQALHRLVYVISIAAVIHYYMQVKADIRLPVAFMAALGILLLYRIIAAARRRPAAAAASAGAARWRGQLRVERILDETPDVRTFRLISPDGKPLPFTHAAGQYLPISLRIDGKKVYRTYTIASSPARTDACELTIKREGTASRHLHERIRPGDLLEASSPGGSFFFTPDGEAGVVLLAGGVGITPLMAIVRWLTDRHWPGEIFLVYSNKTEGDIVFRKELDALQERHPNLHITHTLTRNVSPAWRGATGRISGELLTRTIPNLSAYPVYLCGPAEMIRSLRELLPGLGVPESHIHIESFGTRISPPEAGGSEGSFEIRFSRANKSTTASQGRPLLEIAEELGISIDYECRSGICGRCRCRLVSGAVAMTSEEALTAEDRRRQLILMCQAHATSDLVIDA